METFRDLAIRDVAAFTNTSARLIEVWMANAMSPLLLANEAAIVYAVAQRERVLELEARESDAHELARRAFVSGAKWWEREKTGATMWGSDQAKAWDVAPDKYPYTNPADVQLQQKEGERG